LVLIDIGQLFSFEKEMIDFTYFSLPYIWKTSAKAWPIIL